MNPYELLQVKPGVSAEELKAAYQRLATQWHPDNFTGAERLQAALRVRELAEAFTVLKDADSTVNRPQARGGVTFPDPEGDSSIQLKTAAEVDATLGERPGDPYARAKQFFETHQIDAALEQIQEAIALNRDKHEYHSLHAKILEAKGGDHRALVTALEECLALDKKDVESAIKLAQVYQGLGMHTRATRYWEWAYNLAPDHPFFVKEQTTAKGKIIETAQDLSGSLHGMLEGAKGLFKFGSKGSK